MTPATDYIVCGGLVPEGEGGLVHLHADEEGVLGELHSGDEVQRCLHIEAHLNPSAQKLSVHRHVTHNHQSTPAGRSGNRSDTANGIMTIIIL